MQEWLEDRPQPAGFCDGCGAPITEADRFCTSCGRPTRELCSWCNATLAEDARFCTSCGQPAVRDRSKVYRRGAVAGKPIAGFAFRAGVYLVDGLITSIPADIAARFLLRDANRALADYQRHLDDGAPFVFAEFADVIEPLLWWTVAITLLGVALQITWNSLGWSPAMRAIGLRIVDAAGNPPGWRRGLKRTFASWLSALALSLGYLAAAWHPEKRTWHDRIAGTWVVDVRER